MESHCHVADVRRMKCKVNRNDVITPLATDISEMWIFHILTDFVPPRKIRKFRSEIP